MPGSPRKRARREALKAAMVAGGAPPDPYVPAMPSPEARKLGRATLYKPEFCEAVIEDAILGHTLTATAALIGVTRQTLYDWRDAHPEFADAIERARALRQRFYEGHLIDLVRGGGDATRLSAVKLALVNVGGDDWKEKPAAETNITFSLGNLIAESMRLGPPVIVGEMSGPAGGEATGQQGPP